MIVRPVQDQFEARYVLGGKSMHDLVRWICDDVRSQRWFDPLRSALPEVDGDRLVVREGGGDVWGCTWAELGDVVLKVGDEFVALPLSAAWAIFGDDQFKSLSAEALAAARLDQEVSS